MNKAKVAAASAREAALYDYFSKLEFQPIDTLPWQSDDYCRSMPVGIVLRRRQNALSELSLKYILVGNERGGDRSNGCSCCSNEWVREIHVYDGWAWAFGAETR